MTPGARVAAAIEILDDIAGGKAAEQALTQWARRSRFAGSKDRAAIRNHVFDVMRSYRLAAHYGNGTQGRALMIGLWHLRGDAFDDVFHGEGHAPSPLTEAERVKSPDAESEAVRLNLPDWLLPEFKQSLGDDALETANLLQQRAPVGLRVNPLKCDVEQAIKKLSLDQITAERSPLAAHALLVTAGARKLRNSTVYQEGLVELQDAASQAVVETLEPGGRALDFCAGGGGKALALAADPIRRVFAHDINPNRMSDLPTRAIRAGADITLLKTEALGADGLYDLVLCDAPCSGSGAWRRAPQGKWTLTPEKLDALQATQDDILDRAAAFVGPGGVLAYATCSVLSCENEARREAFLERNRAWISPFSRRFDVAAEHDGFYVAHFLRR